MKQVILAAFAVSSLAFAAPPPASAAAPAAGHARGDKERGPEFKEEMQKKMHLMLVVGIADALSLNETEALRLSDKIKVFEDTRRPVREAMGNAMRTLKAAAEGDSTAGAQVDVAVQKVLDGRQQMAALDKEMFVGLSKDLTAQKRAQLAIFLARFRAEAAGEFSKGAGHPRD